MPLSTGIYYSISERGNPGTPSLVLLHGAGGSHMSWPAELRRLPGWNVLAVDMPGHGRSEGLGQRSIARYASSLLTFLDERGIHRAILVGQAMGGAIALQTALERPLLVAGLALIASGAYLGLPPDLLENASSPLTFALAIKQFQGLALCADASPDLVEQVTRLLRETRPGVLACDFQACADFDLRETVERIACPTWVSVGSEDRFTPPTYSRYLAGKLPAASLNVISGAGHMAALEHPTRIAAGLEKFLAENFKLPA